MRLPPYPEYKESGTELTEIPTHWQLVRARAIGQFSSSGIDKKSVEGEQFVRMFNYLDVYRSVDKVLRYCDGLMATTTAKDKAIEHAVRAGDILITPSSETPDDIGHAARVADVPAGVVYSYHLVRYRPSAELEAPYLVYLLNSEPTRRYFASVCTGTTRQVLVREDMKSTPICLPPLREQRAIVTFLDRETAKIDALIAEQETLLALLAEKRQATISHGVTRGLDPNAPMKDSGIAWLGEVPAHWDVMKLRNIGRIVRGASPRPAGDPRFFADDDDGESSVPWLTVAEITKDESLYVDEVSDYLTALGAEHSQRFEKGIVVFSNSGATLGVPKILGIDCCANDGVLAFRDLSPHVDPEYLYFFLLTTTQRLRTEMKQGGGQPNLNTDIVKGIGFACPPLGEQSEIIAFLREKFRRFEQLKDAAEQNVALLAERRSALIAATVTGKIDVRGQMEAQAA